MSDKPTNVRAAAPAKADAPGTPQASTPPPAGRPGSLPFTPYGGTTAPYRPKAEAAASAAKTLRCNQCKASGFATRADLDAHVKAEHPKPGAGALSG